MKRILIVCMANYCRSPVAEFLLKDKLDNSYQISSAGIIQFDMPGMDERSIKYLKENFNKTPFHQPKKITLKDLQSSDIIFALDIPILMMLNKKFKKYNNKFRLLGLNDERVMLNDPYKMSKEDYYAIMKKIEYVISKIDI